MAAAPNMEVFEAYFKRADSDQDGRVSGAEAVAFFQGSNLPQHVLAQVWTYANQKQAVSLGRPEFYNALRLVTVAQSGRELTPDIVKAALGPAAAQIPAPKINPVSATSSHMNSVSAPTVQSNAMSQPSTQIGSMAPTAFQNVSVRGQQTPPSMGINHQFLPSQNNLLTRPHQSPATSIPMLGVAQGPSARGSVGPHFPGSQTPNIPTDWLGGRTSGAGAGPTSQFPNRGVTPVNQDRSGLAQLGMTPGIVPKPQTTLLSPSVQPKAMDKLLPSSQPAANDSQALVTAENGFSSNSVFGGDAFSTTSQAKPDASNSFSASSFPSSSNISTTSQNPIKPSQSDPFQNALALSHGGNQLQSQLPVKKNQLNAVQGTLALAATNVSAGPVTSSNPQQPWPKITQSDIQKYTKVFVEVDKDRDGKITGPEARNLFLSWRLPREVLRQVWDLADQDDDSMLSLREFCTALYLMERYREGRPLPAMLPNSLRYDETLVLATGQPPSYSGASWQRNPGLTNQTAPGQRSAMPPGGMKPPRPPLPSLPEEPVQSHQQKARVPELEKHLVNQLSEEEQKAINSKFQEATDADKKVQELEKEILDSREKTEFYRTKMQELVLYKSRCDNRLNEVIERVAADKREVESLARKYEDKYKQSGDVASKLTLDEATFRDIQERKLELYNAIVKMEQGGTADGALQNRVDRIQSDFEELVKALNERCKQYGLRAKPTTLVELPFGWQPGIQEVAADWDEDWDMFNDEGFAIIKDLTLEVENIVAKPKSSLVLSDKTSAAEVSTVPLSSNTDKEAEAGKHEVSTVSKSSNEENMADSGKHEVSTDSTSSNEKNKAEAEKPSGSEEHATEDESAYAHSEDGWTRSPHGSPRKSTLESSSPDFHSKQFGIHDLSPHAKETLSDHGGAESTLSGDKFFDEPSWGASFDNDDTDSIWGLGTINTKETDHGRTQHDSFGMGNFGLNPIRTESPSAGSVFGAEKKSPFFDSVPSTPMYNSSFSPRVGEGQEDHGFDRFSRFDSFNMNGGDLFPQHDSFSRFDSMRSTADPPSLARFDSMRSTTDAPSFGSLSRFDSMRSTVDYPSTGGLTRFDSMRSTTDYSGGSFLSFDDADPFGSTGPFKPSSEGQTPRRSSDNWSAF